MGHPLIDQLLRDQRGVVAVWQLDRDRCSVGAIAHAAGQMRQVHDGVYLSGHAPPTPWQLWKAATLSTPGTVLADWSAASFLEMRDRPDRMPTTVVRPGSGGRQVIGPRPERLGSLNIRRSTTLAHDVVTVDGIPCTSVPRTLLDLAPRMSGAGADRVVRDVLRKGLATANELRALTAVHRGARGVARLRLLVDEYGPLPMTRGRSDAEVLALAILEAAGIEAPQLNVVVAGGEGDLVFFDRGLIVELDGPQYHQFKARDLAKQRRWEAAGWVVRRLPTDDVYDRPHLLIEVVEAPITERPGR